MLRYWALGKFGEHSSTFTPFLCSKLNFPCAQYLDICTLTHELIVDISLCLTGIQPKKCSSFLEKIYMYFLIELKTDNSRTKSLLLATCSFCYWQRSSTILYPVWISTYSKLLELMFHGLAVSLWATPRPPFLEVYTRPLLLFLFILFY